MKYLSVTGSSAADWPGIWHHSVAKLLCGAALLFIIASANADQLLVTGANGDGNAVYDLGISPSGSTPLTPVIASTVTQLNSDGATHGKFDALVWVPNSYCNSLDLIVADATKGQIVRYAGASTQANCYQPTHGTPTVNPAAQVIFKWSKPGSGPANPNGVSADARGNVFVVSSSGPWDSKPSVWVLPFNASANLYCSGAAGVYCAPVLIDGKFNGTLTLFLAETLVASTSAVTSTKTVLWNAGDLLVLVGDSFDARLMVYSQSKLYNSKGLLATSALPLNQPTSTPIPWVKFLGELAAPFGMDLWPANATLGTNASVLFTTIDGRILSFDTVQNKFVTDFADRLGPGLQKLKVGSYPNVPYAFVAQLQPGNAGKILALGAPPASGPANNKPLATVSHGVMAPMGLAVAYSGSQSVPTAPSGTTPCASPNPPCVFAPLGPEAVSTLNAYPGDNLSGTVLEQNCIVQTDPRVTISAGVWSCNQAPALPIGAGTAYCPALPSGVIPGSVCGHSGPTGAGFAVIEGTATGIDPNDNNSFITTAANVDTVLPGPTNLECAGFATPGFNMGQIPLIAWGTRSDLPTVEGTIPEDSQFGSPLGGQPGYLTELTGPCDSSSTGSRELSMFAIGLALSNTSQSYVYTLQNQKYQALQQTVSTAAITSTVQNTLAGDITAAENYVGAAQSGNFASNINCALAEIAAADNDLRHNLTAFSSNLVTTAPGGGNQNPAGDIDGRLANWYTVLNTMLAGKAPYASWPLPPSAVPVCAVSGPPQITSFFINAPTDPNPGYTNWTTINAASCNITDLYAFTSGEGYGQGYTKSALPAAGPGSNFDINYNESFAPPYVPPGWGTDPYTLTCFSADGTQAATASILNTSGFTGTATLAIQGFTSDVPGGDIGYLAWTTINSSPSTTTCTITDEYGGAPYYQWPVTGLPSNSPSDSGYEYYPYAFGNAFCPETAPAQNTDTITLTCSDPTTGTAISALTLSNPGCGD
jgi:hypothetical protein